MKLTKKRDLIGYKELNRFSRRIKKRHMSTYGQLPNDDENKYILEEVLIGMEYDMDPDLDEEPENISEKDKYGEDTDLIAPV